MVAEIQKLEAAARMAMGHFESPIDIETSAKQRSVLSYLTYALMASATVGLVVALF